MSKKIISLLLVGVLCISMVFTFVSCKDDDSKGGSGKDDLIIMTENLDGLFNPFFSTSANDGTIVAMTQIGMLTSKLNDKKEVEVAFGENEATATLDFMTQEIMDGSNVKETVYTFVLKNGIKFSDGHPLTMEDVLFNLYVYLDPVYTGSATIYSTDIKGLTDYRLQTEGADEDSDTMVNELAASRAMDRLMALVDIYWQTADDNKETTSSPNKVTQAEMLAAIAEAVIPDGYKEAVEVESNWDLVTTDNIKKDYELALKYFREELETDFAAAKDSFTEEPYKSHAEFQDEIFCFMFNEGYVTVEYNFKEGTTQPDYNSIKRLSPNYTNINTKEEAINYVFNDKITYALDEVLLYWATSGKLVSDFTAKAKEVFLLGQAAEDNDTDGLKIPNIEGIVSLGHKDGTADSITVNGTEYKIAKQHNDDGTPKNENEYDVLQITINGIDPKAVWNFAFSVAPQHYYGKGSSVGVDIKNNKFGVVWSSFDYMRDVLQTPDNNKLPMGAGPYKVTNRSNDDNPDRNDFFSNNIVYFKANENFHTVGAGIENAKISKIRYQVVSATNALGALQDGSVDYITPQYSMDNYNKIAELEKSHFEMKLTDQLGYGYIGINASFVENQYIRKAIMAAMNTTLALDYYAKGTASQIYWPMSQVSWAFPSSDSDKVSNTQNYPQMGGTFSKEKAIENINAYMEQADSLGYDKSDLKLTFTIAGSNLNDHPCYKVFRDAADLLNSLDHGWQITVEPDTQALTKLSTGSLAVWAAAWGSSLDPDMYQVYHKNSGATSVKAWGYPHLLSAGSEEEKKILNELAERIELGRSTNDRDQRKEYYREAMSYVLDLAVELPVYQRSTVYVYNTDVIDTSSLPSVVNPYSSPLDRIWEVELKK